MTTATATKDTTEPKTAASKISPEVRAVADRFKEGSKVDDATGVTTPPADFYTKEADHVGLSEETLNRVHNFNKMVTAGTALGFGELGNAAMAAKGSDLQSVSCEVKTVDNGRMEMYMPRVSTGRNPKTGETTTSHGRVSVDWVTGVGDRNGQMSHVLNHLKELGSKTLGNH